MSFEPSTIFSWSVNIASSLLLVGATLILLRAAWLFVEGMFKK